MSLPLTILFATSTGNAEECATRAATKAATLGFKPELSNVRDYELSALKEASTLLLIASTWGEGEPPDDAIPFWDELQKLEEGSLARLRYGVFALGDTSYEHFCGFGQNCDRQLEKLGASRILPCKPCDLDYDDHVQGWFKEVFEALNPSLETAAA